MLSCFQMLAMSFLAAQDPSPSDQMMAIGDKALQAAKDMYSKKEYFDAIGEAERARGIFQALAELFDAQKRNAERKNCEELVKQCNQLIKLANDGRKGDARTAPKAEEPPKPAPAAPPPPPAVKEPEPDPSARPSAAEGFARILSGEIELTDAVRVVGVLRGLKDMGKGAGPWKDYGKIGWTIIARLLDGSWAAAPEDRATFKEYAQKFLAGTTDHRQAAHFLIRAAESVEANVPRWRLFRLVALAHVQASLQASDSALRLELAAKGKTLDLVQDEREAWVTQEGLWIEGAKTPGGLKSAPKVRDPIRDVYRALATFEAAGNAEADAAKEWIAECKALCSTPEPSASKWLGALKSILEARKICGPCGGTHKKKCQGKCDEHGMIKAACNRCGGLGYAMFGGRRLQCLIDPPVGYKWEDGHTYKVKCTKCQGKGSVPCLNCAAPWSGTLLKELARTDPCDSCEGGGWLVPALKLPCAFCFGTGKRYSFLPPPKK